MPAAGTLWSGHLPADEALCCRVATLARGFFPARSCLVILLLPMGLGAPMDFRVGKVMVDRVDDVTMALTWFALLLLCGPFEIYASIAKSARSVARMISRRRAAPGGPLQPISRHGR